MGNASLGRAATTIGLLLSAAVAMGQQPSLASESVQDPLAAPESAPQSPAMNAESGIHLDVVVTDASGKPVTGLRQGDFSLLDDGKPQKIVSFAAFDGVKSKPDPPVEVILVIDALNNSFVEMGFILQGLEKYLRENGGQLLQPTSIARLTVAGMKTLSGPSLDGNALADVVHGIGASNMPIGVYTFPPSMNALARLAQDEASKPGRKLLIWLGTGWPTPAMIRETYTPTDERQQRENYQLMLQVSKALLDGHMVVYGGSTASDFYMRDFLKGAGKASDLDPRVLSLDVLAFKSGGRGELPAINADSVVTAALNHFVQEASAYYAISFNPPLTEKTDEYHDLKVAIDRAGLNARTVSGYYDQPALHQPETVHELSKSVQQPAGQAPVVTAQLTVAQLTEFLRQEKTKRDAELAKEIDPIQLTERLNSGKLTVLSAELPGAKAKAALMAVGDASAFLDPPAAEIPQRAVPNLSDQRQMMSLAVDYLKKILPKLPDFYAKRLTTSFEEMSTLKDANSVHMEGALHPAGDFKATVYYRGGKEVVHAEGAEERGLITHGTFGPILSTVIVDAAHSSTQWSRWEEGPNGPMAIFRFQVPKTESHYEVSLPAAIAVPGIGALGAMGSTAYHGEMGIDPNSGTILRLVLEADPDLGSSMLRADIMVEYGSVEIGEKRYTCPVRSVSISTGESPQVGMALGLAAMREVTRMDDVVFSGYHVFRTEIRILPD
jgi:VWFA-related protein